MTGKMDRIGKNALANPLFLSLLAALVGIGFLYADAEKWFVPVISLVFQNIGGALITAATFGILFEYFGKLGLIQDAVKFAVGQARASALGVTNFIDDVTRIDHKHLIRSSTTFTACARYSSLFLESHRKEIYERLSLDKQVVKFIRMKDPSAVPQGQGPTMGPDAFFKNLATYDPTILTRVDLYETDRLLSYNYVLFDSGIWVKLYLNSAGIDTPPAFFVARGSTLHALYCADIDRLFAGATKVVL